MESRSHFSYRSQRSLSGLAKRRNGLHSSSMLGEIGADALFQHLGTAMLKLGTIRVCMLDA